MRLRRTFAAALAVLFALVATGCAEDPEPKFAAPTTASPTEEPTETEAPEPEGESPEEFIRRWVELDRTMQNSGDVEPYLSVSSRCSACRELSERISAIYSAGGFVKTKGMTVSKVEKQGANARTMVFDVTVDSAPTIYKESADGSRQRLPGGQVAYRIRLGAEEPWHVTELTKLAS